MVSFSDKWNALKNNEKLSQAFMGRVKPEAPLKNRLDTAQKKLQLQITKLAEIDTKLQQKNVNALYEGVRQEDLIAYGLIPELVGRLPIISTLDTLDKDDLMRVLLEPKNSVVKQYQKLFLLEGVILEFQDKALEAIVKLALEKKAGARALRSVMEEHLLDIMYQLPEMEGIERVVITLDTILRGKDPLYKAIQNRKSA